MKVFFLSFPYLKFGGQGRMVRQMAVEFAHRGHTMSLVCIDSSPGASFHFPGHQTTVFKGFLKFREQWRRSKQSRFFAHGLTFICLLPAFTVCALRVLVSTFLQFFSNDVFVGHGVYESVLVSIFRSVCIRRGNCIGVFHASILGYVPDRKRVLIVPFLKRLTYLVVLSLAERDVLCSLGVPKSIIRVIPYGFDFNSIHLSSMESLDEDVSEFVGNSPYISCVARLCPQKDPVTLVRAFGIFSSRHPEYKLVMVGDGELQEDLIRLVSELGLHRSVLFSGSRENPFSIMQRSIAHVLASRYEGFGLVHAEALLLNVPVIASDVPTGPREILDGPPCSASSYSEASYGILVPPESHVVLASAMTHLVANITHFREKATLGSKSIVARYSTKVMVEALEPLLV